ncbi:MAG: hypothetical protein ACR2MX_18745 [Cyclobacteriaceae bacterium]
MRVFWILLVSVPLVTASCSQHSEADLDWEIAYKNDKNGSTIEGSKQKLINAIRHGIPIRIGWGTKGANHSIEHISQPIWIAILDEQEVIAHLDPQVLSIINWEELSASYSDSAKLKEEWRVVLTTKGEFDAIWYDKETNKQIQRRPQNHAITWFVNRPRTEDQAKPFFE